MATGNSTPQPKIEPIRPTSEAARAQARTLIRMARSAALATLEADGHPFASLTSLATDVDGDPLILISQLSSHTANLARDSRASLLIATSGKGDPLAHPRLSVQVIARPVARESEEGQLIRRRFLARQPKAALYVDFPDFGFVKLELQRASLNGGFGKAYELMRQDIILDVSAAGGLIATEESAIAHMNGDHADAVSLYATALAGEAPGPWRLTGIDPEGIDLMAAEKTARIVFPEAVATAEALHKAMMALAAKARQAS
ncbi:MAG: HugZ family protein [Bosea sp. (in: a-proteobacteria)]